MFYFPFTSFPRREKLFTAHIIQEAEGHIYLLPCHKWRIESQNHTLSCKGATKIIASNSWLPIGLSKNQTTFLRALSKHFPNSTTAQNPAEYGTGDVELDEQKICPRSFHSTRLDPCPDRHTQKNHTGEFSYINSTLFLLIFCPMLLVGCFTSG